MYACIWVGGRMDVLCSGKYQAPQTNNNKKDSTISRVEGIYHQSIKSSCNHKISEQQGGVCVCVVCMSVCVCGMC